MAFHCNNNKKKNRSVIRLSPPIEISFHVQFCPWGTAGLNIINPRAF
jgi:hypothetical protein